MGSLGSATPPNLNLYCRSGSVTMPNLGPDLGPVRLGSGLDRGSEPDCGNPISSSGEMTPFVRRMRRFSWHTAIWMGTRLYRSTIHSPTQYRDTFRLGSRAVSQNDLKSEAETLI